METTSKARYNWYKGKHLYVMIISGLMYFLFVLTNTGATNVVIPMLSGIRGWNETTALSVLTIAGYIAAVAALLIGGVVLKSGPKKVMIVCLIVCGISWCFWGAARSFAVFCIAMTVSSISAYGFQTASTPALVGRWFPRTKGIVLGWVTMGVIISDVIWQPYVPALIGRFGPVLTFCGLGAVYVIVAAIMALTIHNLPEEEGRWPDGLAEGSEEARKAAKELETYKSPYTIAKSLRTKEVWQIACGFALLLLTGVVYVSNVVQRVLSLGYEMDFALSVLQISGIFALFGSLFFGFLDQKLGTKTAGTIFACYYFVMWIFCLLQPFVGAILIRISSAGILFGIGGIFNLIVSMTITKFGRWDFVGPQIAVGFLHQVFVSSGYAIIAIFTSTNLGHTGAYVFCMILTVICFFIIRSIDPKCIGKVDAETAAAKFETTGA
ncbi:MAG: MFS transporter [Clostridiales Family XIII bacterium]|jgi:MFS family permease|nr:MFS transporter [Clostridiales Family XIII bacterium]